MGNYVTFNDLDEYLSHTVLRQLTDDANTGAADVAVVEEAIVGAEAEIDGYIGGLYALPLTTVPALVAEIATQLTVYRLHLRRQRVPEDIRLATEQTRATLQAIADGSITIDATSSTTAEDRAPVMEAYERIHTRDTWSGW